MNAAAAEAGLRPGQSRATALSLQPQLRLGEADPARDAAALQAVAFALLAFTPAVSLAGPQTVLAEVQASLRFFGGRTRLLARLRAALRPLGHAVQLACAPTAQAAQWLASWRDDDDAAAAGGATAAPALGDLPVALLAAARPHLAALQTLGLVTLADLQRQPRDGLARRFGPALIDEIDRATGARADPREPLQPPAVFDSRLELFTRAEDSVALLAGASVLLARLVAWAGARHGRIGGFVLRLHPETHRRAARAGDAGTLQLELLLAEPLLDAAHLQVLLRERLQRLPLAAPVIELGLHCAHLVAAAAPNAELFPSAASVREGWQRLLERLEARLGPQRLQRLEALGEHRPERATRLRPAIGPGSAPEASGASPPPARRAAAARPGAARARVASSPPPPPAAEPGQWPRQSRPVWLLAPPQPLREQGGSPWLAGQPLNLVSGPERIETGWWDDDLVARDYFIAQAADGSLLWIYRHRLAPPPGTSGWYLHGRFG